MIPKKLNLWKSTEPEKLPDFIIGGAMKSGTTSIHAILDSHPDIGIAHDELGFFDIDHIIEHPDFNFYDKKKDIWISQSMQKHPKLLWDWYYSNFTKISKSVKIKGEDSTTYLNSEIAAKRIALQDKPIKLIFILRHPVKRTISNYLHRLKSGRALYAIEDTLKYEPDSILRRSLYKKHLEKYYKYVPSERIKVVLFEDFILDKKSVVKELSDFLEVDFNKFNEAVFNTHSNKTKVPSSLKLQLARNRILRRLNDYRYSFFLPILPERKQKLPIIYRVIDKLFKKINPLRINNKMKISKATETFLDNYFKAELEGIDKLVKKEVYSKWFKD